MTRQGLSCLHFRQIHLPKCASLEEALEKKILWPCVPLRNWPGEMRNLWKTAFFSKCQCPCVARAGVSIVLWGPTVLLFWKNTLQVLQSSSPDCMLERRQGEAELLSVVMSKVVFLMGNIASLRWCVRRGWPVVAGKEDTGFTFCLWFSSGQLLRPEPLRQPAWVWISSLSRHCVSQHPVRRQNHRWLEQENSIERIIH